MYERIAKMFLKIASMLASPLFLYLRKKSEMKFIIALLFAVSTLQSIAQLLPSSEMDFSFELQNLRKQSYKTITSSIQYDSSFQYSSMFDLYIPRNGGVMGNIDSTSTMEWAYGIGDSLVVFTANGSLVPGFPVSLLAGSDCFFPPSMGDLNGDGIDEIVVAAGNGSQGKVFAFYGDGTPVPGFPANSGPAPMLPVLKDIDLDGKAEIIYGVRSGSGGYMQVLDENGNPEDGWPVIMDSYPASSASVADVDENDTLDIIAETRNKIWAWDIYGDTIDGFPFDLDSNNVILNSYSSVLVGDFTGDGHYNLAFGAHEPGAGIAYLLDHRANLMPGWPITTNHWIYTAPIAVDINNDGKQEIIFADQTGSGTPVNYIYAYDVEGNLMPNFPIGPYYAVSSQIIVADIDQDGGWELLFEENSMDSNYVGYFWAVNLDGSVENGWPIRCPFSSYFQQLMIEDINHDGYLEFLGSSLDTSKNVLLHKYNTDIPSNIPIFNKQFQIDKGHTGLWKNQYPLSITTKNNTPKFTVYPNPCLDICNIDGLQKEDYYQLFDISGRFISKGKHQLNVKGLPPGIYILKIHQQEQESNLRLLIN